MSMRLLNQPEGTKFTHGCVWRYTTPNAPLEPPLICVIDYLNGHDVRFKSGSGRSWSTVAEMSDAVRGWSFAGVSMGSTPERP